MNAVSPAGLIDGFAFLGVRRTAARAGVFVMRSLAVLAGFVIFAVATFTLRGTMAWSSGFVSPYGFYRSALDWLVDVEIVMSFILCPSFACASLAGESALRRTSLLLTTRTTSLQVVFERFNAHFSRFVLILLSLLPVNVLLGSLSGLSLIQTLAIWSIPLWSAWGVIGASLAMSSWSRRGRDALVGFYMLEVAAAAVVYATVLQTSTPWRSIDPFAVAFGMSDSGIGGVGLALFFWWSLGLAGAVVAAVQLRPACRRVFGGKAKRSLRPWLVPPVSERRPMLWKELWIERTASLGKLRGPLAIAVIALAGGGTLIGLVILADAYVPNSYFADAAAFARSVLAFSAPDAPWYGAWFVELAIGLRAAASIASERERDSWNAILTSPLSGREILFAKLGGNVFALRWLTLAILWYSLVAVFAGSLSAVDLARAVVDLLVVGLFMSAVGLRFSLASFSVPAGITWTAIVWLVSRGLFVLLSFVASTYLALALVVVNYRLGTPWDLTLRSPLFIRILYNSRPVFQFMLYIVTLTLLVLEMALRFDRLAGRRVQGRLSTALNDILVGRPLAPIAKDRLSRRGRQAARSEPAEHRLEPRGVVETGA